MVIFIFFINILDVFLILGCNVMLFLKKNCYEFIFVVEFFVNLWRSCVCVILFENILRCMGLEWYLWELWVKEYSVEFIILELYGYGMCWWGVRLSVVRVVLVKWNCFFWLLIMNLCSVFILMWGGVRSLLEFVVVNLWEFVRIELLL